MSKKNNGQRCSAQGSPRPSFIGYPHCLCHRYSMRVFSSEMARLIKVVQDSFVSLFDKLRQIRLKIQDPPLLTIEPESFYVSYPLGLRKMSRLSQKYGIPLALAYMNNIFRVVKGRHNERSQERSKWAKDSRGHWQRHGRTAFLRRARRV